MERVVVTKRGADRLRAGHPWIYRSDLLSVTEGIESGDAVVVVDDRGRIQGTAFHGAQSQIALRFVSREVVEVDEAFLRARLSAALALRERIFPGVTALRLVHGEADLLPGLVVDRYGDALSIQTGIPATDRRKETICDLLQELTKVETIVERNDGRTRLLEGLQQTKGVLRGTYQGPSAYREGDAILAVDLLEGQKTGAFLDQRENHLRAGAYASGRSLDLFSYAGGFALQMSQAADSVKAVEISESACEAIRANAERSGRGNVEVICANVFDWLRDELSAGARYDSIVLDPPAFAKNKAAVPAAMRGYKEVNLRALQLLAPGGTLLTFTCSYHVAPDAFEALVMDAARDARRDVQVLERLGA
ncbi:MAG TPA: class I SAM-dependent rRNA methyltransferase, partial [Vulgatibacter sp.]